MNTLVIIGMIAIGLGLLVLAMIGGLILLRPRAPRRPPRQAPAPVAAPEPDEAGNSAPSLAEKPGMLPTPEEDDPHGHINTGVLNVRDFENFEELIAAAEALTKDRDKADD